MKKPLLIVGAGGSAREVAWLAARTTRWNVLAFVEDTPHSPALNGIPILNFEDASDRFPETKVVVAVGSTKGRKLLRERCKSLGFRDATLIDPSAIVGDRVDIGPGSVICAGAIVTVDCRIGEAVQINVRSTISHNDDLGDYVTVSPGVNIAGWVTVKPGAFLGVGSRIIDGKPDNRLVIGEWATVAGGACVIRNVEDGAMVAGVPAIRKK